MFPFKCHSDYTISPPCLMTPKVLWFSHDFNHDQPWLTMSNPFFHEYPMIFSVLDHYKPWFNHCFLIQSICFVLHGVAGHLPDETVDRAGHGTIEGWRTLRADRLLKKPWGMAFSLRPWQFQDPKMEVGKYHIRHIFLWGWWGFIVYAETVCCSFYLHSGVIKHGLLENGPLK